MFDIILKMKMRGFKIFIMVFLLSICFFGTKVYAAVPYTYTITTSTVNVGSVATVTNIMNITFDYQISSISSDLSKIAIDQTSGSTALKAPTIGTPIIAPSDPSNKTLQISIGALDPDVKNYEIRIAKDALVFTGYTPLTDFLVPFSSTELASGFESVFMDNNVSNLNTNIFTYNSPRDISIYVPKQYITSIETIHKKDGLIIPGSLLSYPKLTNIDVKTDAAVKRLKVTITSAAGTKFTRELLPNAIFSGFTTGQAGVDIDSGSEYTMGIMAYDINGKLLQNFSKIEQIQNVAGEVVSDYVPKTSISSNKTITLYDLMKTPATLTSMLTAYGADLNSLNSIKVVSPNTADTRVISSDDTANVFAKALSDNSVQYIKFASVLNIIPVNDVKLARTKTNSGNVVLDGNGSTINGNVIIGSGISPTTDINTYDLRNLTIKGNLTVNVMGGGDCTLTNVTVTGIKTINKTKQCSVTDVVSRDDIPSYKIVDKSLYKIGNKIKIGVKFSEPVFVIGSPILNLNVGIATYDPESTKLITTNDEVVFDYTVRALDDLSSLSAKGISYLVGGDIQATEGESAAVNGVTVDISGAGDSINGKSIYSSISKKNIVIDGIRPTGSIYSCNNATHVIVYKADEPLDRVSAEIATNWLVRYENPLNPTTFIYAKPDKVVLQGDNKTVMIIISGDVTIDFNTTVFMGNVLDIAGNTAVDPILPVALSGIYLSGTQITNTTTNMEYSLDADGTNWKVCAPGFTALVNKSSVLIRTKATQNTLAGISTTVTEDTTAPTDTVTAQPTLGLGNITVQSSEIGTAYLVPSESIGTTINTVNKLETLLLTATETKVAIETANTNTTIVAPTTPGSYSLVVADAAGNVSTMSTNVVTVVAAAPLAPSPSSFIAATGVVAGLTTATTYEYSVATDGSNYGNWTTGSTASGTTIIATGIFTTSSKIKLRVKATATTLVGVESTAVTAQ